MTITKSQLIHWLQKCANVLNENKTYLTELDSAIGDADHGTNIARGFGIVAEQVAQQADKDIGALLKATSMTLMSKVGGASGMLYGNFFMKAAATATGKEALTAAELASLLDAGVAGIIQRGRAELGDKTMIDAWTPAVQALQQSLANGDDLPAALSACAAAAETGMKATIPLQAKKGRASYLGERSIGHQDPGATSTQLILQALAEAVNN
ncbi:MAG: dihydroxyacetone kinase subunit DhaL [Caldilineaceae bacterium]